MFAYLETDRPITAFRNEIRRAVNDAFTLTFYAGFVEEQPPPTEVPDEGLDWVVAQIEQEVAFVDTLFAELKSLRSTAEDPGATVEWVYARAEGYTNSLDAIFAYAKLLGAKDTMLTFTGIDGEDSCEVCQELKGYRAPASWWIDNDLLPTPGNKNYGCECWNCQHRLEDDEGNVYTPK